ncbi:Cinnamoyl-coa reductase [Thalictrum thalictroides]|uniref:Cinnamoyl-coa reductase n=1 Tax=Thalictrum thalictroides TaxID=46969 RepID=A0A7J6UX55_THATH|nr:Cinnamoyl-coa reductase [Thalictrum thalictroides]
MQWSVSCSQSSSHRQPSQSTVSAVMLNPNWPKNQAMDESCWSDNDYCRRTENWYALAKTEAEVLALEYGKTRALNVVTVCPSFIVGPLLQSKMNATSGFLLKMVKDGLEKLENKVRPFVDVRDTAEALLLVYKKPEAEGRYICSSFTLRFESLVNKLKSIYPNYNYPKQIVEGEADWDITSAKLVQLGWKHRSSEETLVDSIQSYQERGHL